MRIGARALLCALGLGVALLTTLGLAGGAHWVADLASHFRVQYAIVGGLAAAGLFVLRHPLAAVAIALVAFANLWLFLPLYREPTPTAERAGGEVGEAGERVRVMLVNVNTANRRAQTAIARVGSEDPDVLVMLEIDRWWQSRLAALEGYAHSVERPREDNFGIAVYSRLPLEDVRIVDLGGSPVPSILARVVAPDGPSFTLLATHPVPPVSASYASLRDAQLAAIPETLAGSGRPIVLLGDLNTSPWSAHFASLIEQSRLRPAREGFGIAPTWPVAFPPLWIPIDHCLVSSDIGVDDFRVGASIGSDHFPLIVDLRLPATTAGSRPTREPH